MTEPSLRAAFETRVEQVAVAPDALEEIRARVARRTRQRRRSAYGLTALATAATAGVVAVVLTLTGATPPVTEPPAAPPSSVGPSNPTAPPAIQVTVPAYFTATVAGRPVLYREFRATTVAQDDVASRVRAALALSVAGAALDPDYGTHWPDGTTISTVTVAGGRIDVGLTMAAGRGAGPDATALQQVVWTATAAAVGTDQPATVVRLTINGSPAGDALGRAPLADTVAPVWVISPQQGATVSGPVDVHLAGVVFEAAARIRVRAASGAVLSDDPVLLDAGAPAQGEAHVALNLPPGRYTVEAYFVSQQDGSQRGLDGHDFTVQ